MAKLIIDDNSVQVELVGDGTSQTKLGTFASPDGTDFCAVKGNGPGTVITLRDGAKYRRILVSDD